MHRRFSFSMGYGVTIQEFQSEDQFTSIGSSFDDANYLWPAKSESNSENIFGFSNKGVISLLPRVFLLIY